MSNLSQRSYSKKEIAKYYDLSEVHYRLFWNLNQSKALHYGYWDATTKNLHEALVNSNKILSERASITPNDVVLDAGCGVGGSTVWLAKNIGCKATGITLSEKQAKQASEYARKEQLDHLANFEVKDYTNTGYPQENFSVVWAMETVCHAEDKSDFLREAFRVLKPGGRLIVADFFKKKSLVGKDAQQIKDWANGWAVTDYATREEFEKKLKEEGFGNVRIEDATQAVMPSIKKLYRAYLLGVVPSKLYNFFNRKTSEYGRKNVETAKLQYITAKKELWKYLIVYAEKA
ncbi:MAG TPA: methyltransferase domain-containing protein [Flavipsychrobacter sp.]|nr:methyltransferase domain-containing protein [Flavipsychrobacter sp.]